MIDPWNPTKEEIIDWAYNDQLQPEQDWELAVSDVENAKLLLQLATDENCEKRLFFLMCLYLMVGDTVRAKWGGGIEAIKVVLSEAEAVSHFDALRWVERTKQLFADYSLFEYSGWCDGGFVRRDHPNLTSHV